MSEIESTPRNVEVSQDTSQTIPHFHPLNPDSRDIIQKESAIESDIRIYHKIGEEVNVQPNEKEEPSKSTILGATFMLTNICLGTTIFTFAVRAKSFGLTWLIIACILVGVINYWTIMRGSIASSKCKENDYSEITEKILGKKARLILNIFIILYSYACMMCFLALIFPLFGRFIQSAAYNNKYDSYSDFEKEKWGKTYIKLLL